MAIIGLLILFCVYINSLVLFIDSDKSREIRELKERIETLGAYTYPNIMNLEKQVENAENRIENLENRQ